VIQHRDFSGAETAQAAVVAADPDPLVACPPRSPTADLARRLGAKTTDLPFRSLRHSGGRAETIRSVFRGLRGARDLWRILRAHPERTVVFAIGIRSGLLASLAATGTGRRIVWSVPDLLPPGLLRWTVRAVARLRANALICLSAFIEQDLVGDSAQLKSRSTVVYPGVDLSLFDPGRAHPGAPRASIVGHISPTKRTDLAIDTLERILTEEPEMKLEIIGEAQFRDEDVALEELLRRRIAETSELTSSVRFRGRVSDVSGALAESGLLLHFRDDEPFGMVLVEAMAQGLPVVAPASGGPLEIVKDGVTGFLFQPGDVDDAADRVLRICRDLDLARRMGRAGRDRVESLFTSDRQLAATIPLLRSTA
jgi:L-malate glycosyltransferase